MFAPPLAEVALKFGPAEYFSLMVLGLVAAVVLASGSLIKAIAMVILGLLLGLVGTDVNSGVLRFAFGISELADGIGFVTVAMGMFGICEIIANLEQKEHREVFTSKVGSLMPTKEDFRRMVMPILRGTALGSALGILPERRAARLLRRLHAGEEGFDLRARVRQRRDRAWAPGRPTTPARRLRSSRCSPSASLERGDGADRRDDDQGIAPGRR
jgi:hypothetical protein